MPAEFPRCLDLARSASFRCWSGGTPSSTPAASQSSRQGFLDVGEGARAVDLGLALTEQIQVGAVEHVHRGRTTRFSLPRHRSSPSSICVALLSGMRRTWQRDPEEVRGARQPCWPGPCSRGERGHNVPFRRLALRRRYRFRNALQAHGELDHVEESALRSDAKVASSRTGSSPTPR